MPIAFETPKTPWFLPRSLFLGAVVSDATTPTFRLLWTPTLYGDRTGFLQFTVEGGLGYAVKHPTDAGERGTATMTYFYQHPITFGLGYQSSIKPGFRWGGHVGAGPVFYGARFDTLPTENRIQGMVEGRLQAGFALGPVEYGVSVGASSPFRLSDRGNSTPYLGGHPGRDLRGLAVAGKAGAAFRQTLRGPFTAG